MPSLNEQESNDESTAEVFEDYSPPSYQDLDTEEEITNDNRYLWILLWIMNFRMKFNIPETATESLIKFIKLVLNEIGNDSKFPDSLYLARKILRLKDRFQSFVPCPKCHKLYRKEEVQNFQQNNTPAVIKCTHIEFLNSTLRQSRFCNTPLSRKAASQVVVIRPELEFPFVGIKQQLTSMFLRPDFEAPLDIGQIGQISMIF